jgi:methionine-rich copper-binding protein CopC
VFAAGAFVLAEATPAGAATAAGVAGASGSTGAGRSAGSAETTGVSATVEAVRAGGGSDVAGVLHAKVTGSVPEDGATLAQAPEAVTLIIDKKAATVEGDPLRVYGPDGSRVDDGRTTVNADGTRLTVLVPTANARPAGRYEVVYRLISSDTHLIAGRLGFTTEAASPAGMVGLKQGGGPGQAGGRVFGLLHGWPDETYPPIVAGVGLGLVALRLLWKRWRIEADQAPPLLPPMQGHLVEDQRDRSFPRPSPSYRPRSSASPPPPRRATAHRASRSGNGRPR